MCFSVALIAGATKLLSLRNQFKVDSVGIGTLRYMQAVREFVHKLGSTGNLVGRGLIYQSKTE